jgi:thiol-disulfide isomerase/thioredoxin
MKKYLLFLMLVQLSLLAHAQKIAKINVNELMQIIDTSSQPIVVSFWATFCGPCNHEIPYFEKQLKLFEKQGVRLLLVSVDFKESFPKKLNAFVAKKKYRSKTVWLSETNGDVYMPLIDSSWGGAIPATLLLNKSKGRRQFFERELSEAEFVGALKKLVE